MSARHCTIEVFITALRNGMRTVMVFGAFDRFGAEHKRFLLNAKARGDRLIAVVAHDVTVDRVKGMLPRYNEIQRFHAVRDTGIADQVIFDNLRDPSGILEVYRPDVIVIDRSQEFLRPILQPHALVRQIHIENATMVTPVDASLTRADVS